MSLHATGLVVALADEARALTARRPLPGRLLDLGDGCGLRLSGMGQQAARAAATALVGDGARALAVIGVAGALDAGLRSGQVISPLRIVDEHGRRYPVDAAWRGALSRRLLAAGQPAPLDGELLSLPRPLSSAAAKAAAAQRYGAVAVDMESAAVAGVAQERGLPFLAVRAIVDERDDALPEALQAAVDAYGRPRPWRLLATLARQPALVAQLPGLAARMRTAMRGLHAAIAAAGPDLAR